MKQLVLIAITICLMAQLSACGYERVVSRSGLLVGLDGAESQIPAKQRANMLPDFLRTPEAGIRVEDEDGTVTLYAKSVRQLMIHLTTAIADGERDLFVEQLLSTRTKDEFYERGLDPGMAFDELVRRQRDVGRLFYFMPMGEYTPGVDFRSIGQNVFRLRLPSKTHEGLYWIGIDVVFEDLNYKLRWFLPNG
jgi:hypothetical protein